MRAQRSFVPIGAQDDAHLPASVVLRIHIQTGRLKHAAAAETIIVRICEDEEAYQNLARRDDELGGLARAKPKVLPNGQARWRLYRPRQPQRVDPRWSAAM